MKCKEIMHLYISTRFIPKFLLKCFRPEFKDHSASKPIEMRIMFSERVKKSPAQTLMESKENMEGRW